MYSTELWNDRRAVEMSFTLPVIFTVKSCVAVELHEILRTRKCCYIAKGNDSGTSYLLVDQDSAGK